MNIDELKVLFEQNDYKFTKQREFIFQSLINADHRHITPEELYEMVHKQNSSIGIATVYRTLSIFEDLGIIKRQEFENQVNRYELTGKDENHDHLICTNCGKIQEVNLYSISDTKEKVYDKYKFKMSDYSLKVYGLCPQCQENLDKEKEN